MISLDLDRDGFVRDRYRAIALCSASITTTTPVLRGELRAP
jgi:hypothetical protein